MALENRYGKFTLPAKGKTFDEWYDDSLCVLEHVVVVRAEHFIIENEIEFCGYSRYFDSLPVGSMAPTYKAIIKITGAKDHSHLEFVKFERVDK